jgi:hypothetical protein
MRRFRSVREQTATDVGEPHRIQLAVREAFPPETPAFTALGQVPAKTDVDETLQPSERLAGVGMPEVVDPPRHHRVHQRHEFLRTDRRSSRRHILQSLPNGLLGGLCRENVDGVLPTPETLAFHEVKPEEIKALGHAGHARLVVVEGQVHPLGDRCECGTGRLGASAADQNGIISIAVQRGTKLRWVAATMPQMIEQVQIGSKDGALLPYESTSPPSAPRTGRATRRCTQLASNFLSRVSGPTHATPHGDAAYGTQDTTV